MEVMVSNELYIFLSTAAAGCCIGLLYDLFRVLRGRMQAEGLFADIQDIIFWLVSAGITFYVIFITNDGRIRWFEFLGLILGLVLYFFSISRLLRRLIDWFIRFLIKFFLLCLKIILTPLLFLYNIISKPIGWIWRCIRRLMRKLQKRAARTGASVVRQVKIKCTKK